MDRKPHGAQFTEVLAQAVDPEAQAHKAACKRIVGLSGYAEVLLAEFARGTSLPLDRMTAARTGGFVEQTEQPDPADLAQ